MLKGNNVVVWAAHWAGRVACRGGGTGRGRAETISSARTGNEKVCAVELSLAHYLAPVVVLFVQLHTLPLCCSILRLFARNRRKSCAIYATTSERLSRCAHSIQLLLLQLITRPASCQRASAAFLQEYQLIVRRDYTSHLISSQCAATNLRNFPSHIFGAPAHICTAADECRPPEVFHLKIKSALLPVSGAHCPTRCPWFPFNYNFAVWCKN